MPNNKIAGKFWDVCDGKLYSASSNRDICNREGITLMGEIPKEYANAGHMTYQNERTGKSYIMFVIAQNVPLRYDIENNKFEKLMPYLDGYEWREYEEEKQS